MDKALLRRAHDEGSQLIQIFLAHGSLLDVIVAPNPTC